MKTTVEKIEKFINASKSYSSRVKEDNKFKYALKRQTSFIEPILKKLQDDIQEIEIDLCSVDKDKNIIRDEFGRLKFDKENQKIRNKKARELMNQEIELENYVSSYIPEDLTEEERFAFERFTLTIAEENA